MSEHEKLRNECRKESFKNTLKIKLGSICANCGCEEYVEYHHIVPLALGGTNNITNFAPLCLTCHKLAHGGRDIRKIIKPEVTGRPKRKPPKNYEDIIGQYINGEIGMTECKELLGLPKTIKMQDVWYYTEFLTKSKISKHKNKVDLLKSKYNCIPKGKIVAIIEFNNGQIFNRYAS